MYFYLIKNFILRTEPNTIYDNFKDYGIYLTIEYIYKYLRMFRREIAFFMKIYLNYLKFTNDIEIDEVLITSKKLGRA